ncbi:hypothetical protein H6G80_32800 [Nostoc sp. FACHB-87]|uniref:hypothetical protein n=1 Tax=Nostocaceae TaxID=1162 RepID=UPI00168955A0|nr:MULTISPECIES: hypothetical protein [Nostocaceae]MBD2458824.1 hypothetical protein [Nostoc sp. FACHB-87]MBD2479871.1 hypothetical protein [Anabaena sp. FACHB-83]
MVIDVLNKGILAGFGGVSGREAIAPIPSSKNQVGRSLLYQIRWGLRKFRIFIEKLLLILVIKIRA